MFLRREFDFEELGSEEDAGPVEISDAVEETSDVPEDPEIPDDADISFDSPDDAGAGADAADLSGSVVDPEGYTPNFSFNVLDGEESFPEAVQKLIQDKETEELMRDLHSRAYGIEHVKQDRQTLREHNTQLMGKIEEFHPVQQDLDKAVHLLKQKDLGGFLGSFGVNDQEVMDYALKKLQLQEQGPEAVQQYEETRSVAQQNYDLQQENRRLQETFSNNMINSRQQELHSTLQRPDVANFADAFDQRMGQKGAFQQEIVNRGVMHWEHTKQDITPDQVIGQMMRMYGASDGAGQPQENQYTAPGQTAQVAPRAQQQVAVIPSLPGNSTSPVTKAVRSIADLKHRAGQFEL